MVPWTIVGVGSRPMKHSKSAGIATLQIPAIGYPAARGIREVATLIFRSRCTVVARDHL
jgi:hypothetical protein